MAAYLTMELFEQILDSQGLIDGKDFVVYTVKQGTKLPVANLNALTLVARMDIGSRPSRATLRDLAQGAQRILLIGARAVECQEWASSSTVRKKMT